MLSCLELLYTIVGGWIFSLIILLIMKLKRGANLPKGAISLGKGNPNTSIRAGYNIFLLLGMGIISFLNFFIIFLCLFNLWDFISEYIALRLPKWVNWIGIIGIWIHNIWGVAVFAYNINYTPAYKPMKSDYVLATGGPYKYIRHPMYIAKAIVFFFFFLATGIWFSLFGALSWIGLKSQAKMEEEALSKKFGEDYNEYFQRTGRFWPKRRK